LRGCQATPIVDEPSSINGYGRVVQAVQIGLLADGDDDVVHLDQFGPDLIELGAEPAILIKYPGAVLELDSGNLPVL
jgi:hypothetical protein